MSATELRGMGDGIDDVRARDQRLSGDLAALSDSYCRKPTTTSSPRMGHQAEQT